MTERRGDQGFAVTPQRIGGDPGGGGRRRTRRLGIAAVIVVAAGIVGVAAIGPRLSGRPSLEISFFATPTPDATPTPAPTPPIDEGPSRPPIRTPLPLVTRPDGVAVTGRIALRDRRVPRPRLRDRGDRDSAPGRSSAATRSSSRRRRAAGRASASPTRAGRTANRPGSSGSSGSIPPGASRTPTEVASFDVVSPDVGLPEPPDRRRRRRDGRRGLLASAVRSGDGWRFRVAPLDVAGRRLGATTELGVSSLPEAAAPGAPSPGEPTAEPSGAPPTPEIQTELYLDGPHLRLAPDGRVAFAWGTIQRLRADTVTASQLVAWRIDLDGFGAITAVEPIAGLGDLPPYCSAVGFAAADRLAWMCPAAAFGPTPDGAVSWRFGTVDLAGRAAGTVTIPADAQGFFSQPIFDRANGIAYAWDPLGLRITRIDVDTLASDSLTLDPAAARAPGVAPGGGTAQPDWHGADSAIRQLAFGQLAGSPDGSRLYAIGFDREPALDAVAQASLGVFVIDRATLALLDRWAPAADYLSVAAMDDGKVAAAGLPGLDEKGRDAPWQASLTVHDPADGRILVRFGALGEGMPPLVVDR